MPVLPPRLSALILVVLALAIPAWWMGLFLSTSFRSLFAATTQWEHLRSFGPADLGVAVATGVAGARALGRPLGGLLAGIVCGGWGYATVWTCTAALTGALAPLGAVTMVAGLASACLACDALVPPRHDR